MKDKLEEHDTPSLATLINGNINVHTNLLESSLCIKDRSELDKHLKHAIRSKEWFNASATKLNILVQQLDVLKRHSHYKVRKELAETIHLLLTTCPR